MSVFSSVEGTFQLWGHSIQVDWAEPEKDVDDEVMQRVRVLYVRICFATGALFNPLTINTMKHALMVTYSIKAQVSK